jgi:hypothetical protein
MTEISRFSGGSDATELEFVKCKVTSTEIMELAIYPHIGELSVKKLDLFLIGLGEFVLGRSSTTWCKRRISNRVAGEIWPNRAR